MWILLLEIVQFLKSLLGQFLLSNLAENLGQSVVFGFAKSRNLPRSGTGLDRIAIVDIVVLVLLANPVVDQLVQIGYKLRVIGIRNF